MPEAPYCYYSATLILQTISNHIINDPLLPLIMQINFVREGIGLDQRCFMFCFLGERGRYF